MIAKPGTNWLSRFARLIDKPNLFGTQSDYIPFPLTNKLAYRHLRGSPLIYRRVPGSLRGENTNTNVMARPACSATWMLYPEKSWLRCSIQHGKNLISFATSGIWFHWIQMATGDLSPTILIPTSVYRWFFTWPKRVESTTNWESKVDVAY